MWEAIKKYDKRWYILLLAVFIVAVVILFRNNEMIEKEQGSIY
jgi:competence protein ComEA